ncbi:MAG: 3-methylornithine--L-lysine ligase PylC [Deltaproteobacteria bacterium]|nr:MAG: 3-methylornithine--L-lysine ligase PylC [Deltaproteobacteria bacterium]
MLVAVIGGNLQGIEAAYLARKAGWDVLLIDKIADVPASGLCSYFIQMDVTRREELSHTIKSVDLVIPALENYQALYALTQEAHNAGIPIVFDFDAYQISSSKIESNRLFAKVGVPVPKPWPECGFPVVAKPSASSGSEGVRIFSTKEEMDGFEEGDFSPEAWVLQEFVEGPSYSLEILGVDGKFFPLQVTDLDMDMSYDCKRVTAPTELAPDLVETFEKISADTASALNLKGIMDVEVILNNGELKVLEIDARLPSQTPTTVFWSTGLNIVQMLGEIFVSPATLMPKIAYRRGVIYEHINVSPGMIEIAGEHIMTGAGPLHLETDFFGADEAITNYIAGRDHWVATLIVVGQDLSEAWTKRNTTIKTIAKRFRIDRIRELKPDRITEH